MEIECGSMVLIQVITTFGELNLLVYQYRK